MKNHGNNWMDFLPGFETMTSWTPGKCSIHWAMRTHGEPGHLTEFLYDTHLLHTAGLSSEHMVNSDKWMMVKLQLGPFITDLLSIHKNRNLR